MSLQCPPRAIHSFFPSFPLATTPTPIMSIAGSLTPRDVTPTLSLLGEQVLASLCRSFTDSIPPDCQPLLGLPRRCVAHTL